MAAGEAMARLPRLACTLALLAVAAVAAAPSRADLNLEVCGVGWLAEPPPRAAAEFAALREQVIAALRQGDGRARVAALVLQGAESADAGAKSDHARAVAAAALQARDPAALRWALGLCGSDPRCQAAPLALWRELDPDNAVPWLWALEEDPTRRASAWQAATAASRYSAYPGRLAAAVQQALQPQWPGYLQALLLMDAQGIEAALYDPSDAHLFATCRPAPGAPLDRCAVLAETIVARGDTMMAVALGATIGRLAGWPASRVRALNAEHEQWLELLLPLDEQPLSCAVLQRLRETVTAAASGNEVARLRRLAAAARR